jgi:hypothetical protein
MKKGKLTKVEKYIIKGMVVENKSDEDISKFTDRSLAVIKKERANVVEEINELVYGTPEEEIDPELADAIREDATLFAKRPGISIMTEMESERSDDARQKRSSKLSDQNVERIHKIR